MINLQRIRIKFLIGILIILLILFNTKNVISSNNKIIFKINDKAYTSIDYQNRLKYLDFVGNNSDLNNEIILDDFISVNIFYEYYMNNVNKYKKNDNKIIEIYNNIEKLNKENNKKYLYEIDKNNILLNIKLDFVRKTILENILNKNINNIKKTNDKIDLLYKFKVNYINFKNNEKKSIKSQINDLKNINVENIKLFLKSKNINYFIKEREINDINKIDERIKKIILSKNNFDIIEKNRDISIIFIEKKFETYDGLVVELYSVRSKKNISEEYLKCKNLINLENKQNIDNKEYKFVDLNNELKNNLVNIDDYLKFKNNNENIYIVLCNIKFDIDILNNVNLNKIINLNVNNIEKNFIKKYSKIYNLIKFDA